ncbi:N-acetylmuramoyl-L-alanine amidase family protein [Mitsuokella sp. WILCCON 0060]|uniref:N-acetylmuramoyl-L-alanine amidase family protein n=1 Tax=Mitsuokella sp. WILCCON 0060 TaxID=3345341 RepID=UPI003F1C1DE3
MKIFINPGHSPNGDPDPGALDMHYGQRECDVAAGIAANCAFVLESLGYDQVQILQSNNLRGEAPGQPNVTARANSWDADIFVSIHANACSGHTARGCETYYCTGSDWGFLIAQYVQAELYKSVNNVSPNFPNRGVKPASSLAVLRWTRMPAILVETAFIDEENDALLLQDYQGVFGYGIANGLHRFLTDYKRPEDDVLANHIIEDQGRDTFFPPLYA